MLSRRISFYIDSTMITAKKAFREPCEPMNSTVYQRLWQKRLSRLIRRQSNEYYNALLSVNNATDQ